MTVATRPTNLPDAVGGFVGELRDAGVGVSLVAAVDAMTALTHVDIGDRTQFRSALSATLLQRADERPTFDAVFDRYFQAEWVRDVATDPATMHRSGAPSPSTDGKAEPPADHYLDRLLQGLLDDDPAAIDALLERTIDDFAGLGRQQGATVRYHLARIQRNVDLSRLLQQLVHAARARETESGQLADHLLRAEALRTVDELRRRLEAQLRQRLADATDEHPDPPPGPRVGPGQVDVQSASPSELRELRLVLRPLARRLASRLAQRRRRHARGRLDVRRTMRRSLSSGGVPLEPAFRRPHVTRPDLALLCDVSGSVAEFAHFTLALVNAVSAEFARVRSFAFIDGVDEVSALLTRTKVPLNPRHVLTGAEVTAGRGHSNHALVFERFLRRYATEFQPAKTTLIITGDARNNGLEPGAVTLRELRQRVRRLYWLNPEPRDSWDVGDSVIGRYAPHCDAVHAVSTLDELADFVATLE